MRQINNRRRIDIPRKLGGFGRGLGNHLKVKTCPGLNPQHRSICCAAIGVENVTPRHDSCEDSAFGINDREQRRPRVSH